MNLAFGPQFGFGAFGNSMRSTKQNKQSCSFRSLSTPVPQYEPIVVQGTSNEPSTKATRNSNSGVTSDANEPYQVVTPRKVLNNKSSLLVVSENTSRSVPRTAATPSRTKKRSRVPSSETTARSPKSEENKSRPPWNDRVEKDILFDPKLSERALRSELIRNPPPVNTVQTNSAAGKTNKPKKNTNAKQSTKRQLGKGPKLHHKGNTRKVKPFVLPKTPRRRVVLPHQQEREQGIPSVDILTRWLRRAVRDRFEVLGHLLKAIDRKDRGDGTVSMPDFVNALESQGIYLPDDKLLAMELLKEEQDGYEVRVQYPVVTEQRLRSRRNELVTWVPLKSSSESHSPQARRPQDATPNPKIMDNRDRQCDASESSTRYLCSGNSAPGTKPADVSLLSIKTNTNNERNELQMFNGQTKLSWPRVTPISPANRERNSCTSLSPEYNKVSLAQQQQSDWNESNNNLGQNYDERIAVSAQGKNHFARRMSESNKVSTIESVPRTSVCRRKQDRNNPTLCDSKGMTRNVRPIKNAPRDFNQRTSQLVNKPNNPKTAHQVGLNQRGSSQVAPDLNRNLAHLQQGIISCAESANHIAQKLDHLRALETSIKAKWDLREAVSADLSKSHTDATIAFTDTRPLSGKYQHVLKESQVADVIHAKMRFLKRKELTEESLFGSGVEQWQIVEELSEMILQGALEEVANEVTTMTDEFSTDIFETL